MTITSSAATPSSKEAGPARVARILLGNLMVVSVLIGHSRLAPRPSGQDPPS